MSSWLVHHVGTRNKDSQDTTRINGPMIGKRLAGEKLKKKRGKNQPDVSFEKLSSGKDAQALAESFQSVSAEGPMNLGKP